MTYESESVAPIYRRPLWQQQKDFTSDMADLIWWADNMLTVDVVLGEVARPEAMAEIYAAQGLGIKDSLHTKKLAGDLQVFIDGVYQKEHEAYEKLGRRWKEINPLNRWGGDFKRDDADHFERREE